MTITVPRHDEFQLAGWGLVKGLLVTAKHFVQTYVRRKRNWRVPGEEPFPGGSYGIFTIQYPEERAPIPDRYRGLPILLYDDASRAELCTACQSCVRACPVGAIQVEQATDAEGKKLPYASSYTVDYGLCINCGFCVEACNFGALFQDHTLETARLRHADLYMTKARLLRPVSYFEKISPSLWAEVREDAMKRLAGTVNRRPSEMGRVPKK